MPTNATPEFFDKRRRDILRPNFCFTCNGSGGIPKPSSEWDDGEAEYMACPRVNPPTKTCPDCKGTGSREL